MSDDTKCICAIIVWVILFTALIGIGIYYSDTSMIAHQKMLHDSRETKIVDSKFIVSDIINGDLYYVYSVDGYSTRVGHRAFHNAHVGKEFKANWRK